MNDFPRKALVLAAGYGTRMRPLTHTVPKALLPLWNRTLLDLNLDLLASWGVTDVLVNTHHLPERIEQHINEHPRDDLRVELSYEPEILGTGGAVANARAFLDDKPFWVVNADIAADVESEPFLGYTTDRDCIGALWMHDQRGPRTVEMRDDRVINFRSSQPGSPGTHTFCGVQLVSPDILRYIPHGEFSTIVQAYEKAMADGRVVSGIRNEECYWADMGTPSQYLDAHREVRQAWENAQPGARLFDPDALARERNAQLNGVRLSGFAAFGANATFAPGAVVRDSVIWRGATIASGARLNGAIVGRGTTLNGEIRGIAVQPAALGFPGLRSALGELGWDATATTALPLAARPSNRSFARLRSATREAIAIRYSLERAENACFTPNARFLKKRGVPVPDILLDRPAQCLTIVQDLGDRSLQAAVAEGGDADRLYRQVLDATLRIHACTPEVVAQAGIELSQPMSAGVLEWERGYFADNFAAPYRCAKRGLVDGALRELAEVSRTLTDQPEVLIHRDLQSSNVLLTEEDARIWLIDFQGMRLGPAAYDVASLLCDPYVSLDRELQLSLLEYYDERAPHPVGPLFWSAAIQRLAQALGAYARLGRVRATARFGEHLAPGMRMLLRALDFVDNLSHLRELLCYVLSVTVT